MTRTSYPRSFAPTVYHAACRLGFPYVGPDTRVTEDEIVLISHCQTLNPTQEDARVFVGWDHTRKLFIVEN